MTDWNDPEDRARLIESIGAEAYNRVFERMRRQIVVSTVNGHAIFPVQHTRFGRLFQVNNTDRAFSTQAEAEAFANEIPKGNDQ